MRLGLPEAALEAHERRLDKAIPCGTEGGGVVVAAGSSPEAQALLGSTVGFVSGNSFAQYRSVNVDQCFPMPAGWSISSGAPNRSTCCIDGLCEAMLRTGATVAFDAIGGGEHVSTSLSCMERVGNTRSGPDGRTMSDGHHQVYVYGGLDPSPTILRRDFGASWGVGSWRLRPYLGRIGAERAEPLRRRVAAEVTSTFASSYGLRLSLAGAVDPDMVKEYGRRATGLKALVTPHE